MKNNKNYWVYAREIIIDINDYKGAHAIVYREHVQNKTNRKIYIMNQYLCKKNINIDYKIFNSIEEVLEHWKNLNPKLRIN